MENTELRNSWLRRLGRIGFAGSERVAETLSQMVDANFEIESTKAKLCILHEIPLLLKKSGTSDLLISIHMDLCGQISGRSVLVFPWECAERLDKRLWSQIEKPPRFLSEMSYTAIKELANVVTSAYMMVLEDWIDISMLPSIPDFSVGVSKTVLDSLIFRYSNQEKFLVCLSNHFIERNIGIRGSLLIFLVSQSVQMILDNYNDDYSENFAIISESKQPNVITEPSMVAY